MSTVMNRYPPYPKYKASGVEWLGDVPEHWDVTKVKFETPFQVGWTPPTKDEANFDGDNKWLTIGDLKQRVVYESNNCISDEAIKKASMSITPKGSLLYSFKLSVGTVAFAGEDVYTNEAIASFLENEKTDLLYLYYATPLFLLQNASTNIYGAKILNQELIRDARLVLPNKDEQTTIANFLDTQSAKIDTLIAKQQRMIALLGEKRQALVDYAIKQNDTVYLRLGFAVDEILRPVDRTENDLYESLGLYNRGRGIFHKSPKTDEELGDSDFYWVEEGDLILSGQFAWEGAIAIAKKSENNCIVSHRYPILRGKAGAINTEYLWAYLTTKTGDFLLNECSIGSAGRNRPLNIGTLLKEKIPVPTMSVQLEVTKIVKAEQILKVSVDKVITLLQERRSALISAAVTGQIDVRAAV